MCVKAGTGNGVLVVTPECDCQKVRPGPLKREDTPWDKGVHFFKNIWGAMKLRIKRLAAPRRRQPEPPQMISWTDFIEKKKKKAKSGKKLRKVKPKVQQKEVQKTIRKEKSTLPHSKGGKKPRTSGNTTRTTTGATDSEILAMLALAKFSTANV